jgi:hypothetical protein
VDNPVGDALLRLHDIDTTGVVWFTNEEEVVLDDGETRIVIPKGALMSANTGSLDLGIIRADEDA